MQDKNTRLVMTNLIRNIKQYNVNIYNNYKKLYNITEDYKYFNNYLNDCNTEYTRAVSCGCQNEIYYKNMINEDIPYLELKIDELYIESKKIIDETDGLFIKLKSDISCIKSILLKDNIFRLSKNGKYELKGAWKALFITICDYIKSKMVLSFSIYKEYYFSSEYNINDILEILEISEDILMKKELFVKLANSINK